MRTNKSRIGTASMLFAALPLTLGACGAEPGPAYAPVDGDGRRGALTLTSSPLLPVEDGAGVELYVQSPFDFESGRFDLNQVDYLNADPLVRAGFAIPYDQVEALLNATIAKHTAQPLEGIVDGPTDTSIRWKVTLSGGARFTHRRQPRLSPWGSAADNGVRVDLDTQVEVNMNAHVEIHASAIYIPDPDEFDVPMHAVFGGHGSANLAFFPQIRADILRADATLDDANLDFVGLDDQAIGLGAVIGGGIAYATGGSVIAGAFLGAITGEVAIEAAKDYARERILEEAAKAFEASRGLLYEEVKKAVAPHVTNANDVLNGLLTKPIANGLTLGQLEAQLGMSLDVRSATRHGVFRTALTTRFANVPAQGRLNGRLRLPKTRCEYDLADAHPIIGSFLSAQRLVPANQELAQVGCAGVDVGGLLHQVFYGQNPDRVLETGAPENNLITWAPLGTLEVGAMEETDDSFYCPFAVTGLPDAAFVELSLIPGSSLASALSPRQLREGEDPALNQKLHGVEPMGEGRFVLLSSGGVSVTLNHTGDGVVAVEIGSAGPASTLECPSIQHREGTGLQAIPEARPQDLDIETCTVCGPEGARPGADVIQEARTPGVPVISAAAVSARFRTMMR